ncbi:MAG: hypothetical protein FWH56_02785 [Betaproteobacteria bacterium]|nr:hypothetical protein [Betaproteobacteria bacterium]
MSKANLKLHVAFEFEIDAPEALLAHDHVTLCRKLSDMLGPLVLQGMPKVTATQLSKVGASLIGHHCHLDAKNLSLPAIDRAVMIAAAPHLTDEEINDLTRQLVGKTPEDPAELQRLLRRRALALANEYRLVPCRIEGKLKSGGTFTDTTLDATLNLTNGSVMVGDSHRQSHLQQGVGVITLVAADGAVRIAGNCEGHTLSGPVINVSIADIAESRDALIQLWQAKN